MNLEKHVIPAGSVFFHGTAIPKMGVRLDPDGLAGDKWFTTYQDYAKCYADRSNADAGGVPSEAVFQVTIKDAMFVAKQVEGIDATTGKGRWASAVDAGVLLGYGFCAFAIERAFIQKAIQVRFGHDTDVVGMYKPSPQPGMFDELFLLSCEQRISYVRRCQR